MVSLIHAHTHLNLISFVICGIPRLWQKMNTKPHDYNNISQNAGQINILQIKKTVLSITSIQTIILSRLLLYWYMCNVISAFSKLTVLFIYANTANVAKYGPELFAGNCSLTTLVNGQQMPHGNLSVILILHLFCGLWYTCSSISIHILIRFKISRIIWK